MRYALRGKRGGLLGFLAISALVIGGLGWVTFAALRLEQGQVQARAEGEFAGNIRLALWRLDSRVLPILAKEDSRPYNHYSAVYAPALSIGNDGYSCKPGTVLELSPLLTDDLSDGVLLHFRVDDEGGWGSPQVLSETLKRKLTSSKFAAPLDNATAVRQKALGELARQPAKTMLAFLQSRNDRPLTHEATLVPVFPGSNLNPQEQQSQQEIPNPNPNPGNYVNPAQPTPQQLADLQKQSALNNIDPEFLNRAGQFNQVLQGQQGFNSSNNKVQQMDSAWAYDNTLLNGENWFSPQLKKAQKSKLGSVSLGPMVPLWLPVGSEEKKLAAVRLVKIGDKRICQGILLDWPRIQGILAEEVEKLFPDATFEPVAEEELIPTEGTMAALSMMAALPVRLNPNAEPETTAVKGWTPLRIGLATAWLAALVALFAVGLGGWSIIDLSERRIRFVSAVTHELRTPLTTLRLYLDMLAGGMVKDEQQKTEYIQTLNAEADRLTRLVGNVLDFSRLENQRPRLEKVTVPAEEFFAQLQASWQGRCQDVGKELVIDNSLGENAKLSTDVKLVAQVLGNLVDNACKYSQDAKDRRIWVRALREEHKVVVEVEDRGPGVPAGERRVIFRPFRRGNTADVTAGGVGLGLALAQRWANLLGGRLGLEPSTNCTGARFRLELPVSSLS